MLLLQMALIGMFYPVGHTRFLRNASEGVAPVAAPSNPRVLCMVFTTVANWPTKGRAVRNTWARRCDAVRFFYSQSKGRIDDDRAVALKVDEGRGHLTAKTNHAFRQMYQNFTSQFDWYMKADDDTYVIMENLHHMLRQFNPEKPFYIGERSMAHLQHGYNSGGAGYLLSREATRLFVEGRVNNSKECKPDGVYEDMKTGMCLQSLNIYPVDTRDKLNRLTFHSQHPYELLEGKMEKFYWYQRDGVLFGNKQGYRMLSPDTTTFHYVDPAHMYMYDFLLYELNRHGGST